MRIAAIHPTYHDPVGLANAIALWERQIFP